MGGDLRKGIALFRQRAPSCVETYDISHAIAAHLKAHWRDDSHWQAFLQQAGTTLSHFQQTDLAFLLPPRQRTKARYMAIDAHIDWAQRLIAYHDLGDFSAIGRPCVSSATAWARLHARALGQAACRALERAHRTALRHARGVVRGTARCRRHGAG